MSIAGRGLQIPPDADRTRAARLGGGTLAAIFLGGIAWLALAEGGTRVATPMGQALAGSGVAALATAAGALPALVVRRGPRSASSAASW